MPMRLFVRANGVMDDAIKANPDNGKLYLRAPQIALRQTTPLGDDAKVLAKIDRARGLLDKAAVLVKPTDPEFDDTVGLAAQITRDPESLKKDPKGDAHNADLIMKDFAAQEKVLRDALKVKPNDIPLRIQLAEMLSHRYDRLDEAIDLLKNLPDPAPEDRAGPRGLRLKDTQLLALCNLTNLRLDKLMALPAPQAEKDALMPQIEEDDRKLEARAADNPLVMRLKAKILLAKGNTADAVTVLSQAVAKVDAQGNPQLRYELMYLSAKCYLATGQFGSAKAYLEEILKSRPDNDEARLLLTQIQLREFRTDDAEKNLAVLEKNVPGDLRVVQMRVTCLEQEKKPDEAKKVYAKLPEDTRTHKLDKASVALLTNQQDEAKRLLEAVASADPGDIERGDDALIL